MDFNTFIAANKKLSTTTIHQDILKAIWYLKINEWHHAHDIVSRFDSVHASWIHGLLHKMEGDMWNANYWYRKAGIENPEVSVEHEIEMIIDDF